MKQSILATFILLVTVMHATASPYDAQHCNRETFTHEELNRPYAPVRKTLSDYTSDESKQITAIIEDKAREESNSYHRPCLENSVSCFGQDESWTYSKQRVVDSFGNLLRKNGEIVSKKHMNWPPGKYFAHETQIGYSCSWDGQRPDQCKKWCSLTVIDDRFRD